MTTEFIEFQHLIKLSIPITENYLRIFQTMFNFNIHKTKYILFLIFNLD